jgi:hypothetical protein
MNDNSGNVSATPTALANQAARLAPGRALALVVGFDQPVNAEPGLAPAGCQHINLSLVLSQRLLDTLRRQVAVTAPQALDDLLAGDGPLLVDHIELLFDPLLQVDPLRGLKLASRRRRLLVIWPGRLADGAHLTYAEPGHPEYRRYGPADLAGVAILDAAALRQVE